MCTGSCASVYYILNLVLKIQPRGAAAAAQRIRQDRVHTYPSAAGLVHTCGPATCGGSGPSHSALAQQLAGGSPPLPAPRAASAAAETVRRGRRVGDPEPSAQRGPGAQHHSSRARPIQAASGRAAAWRWSCCATKCSRPCSASWRATRYWGHEPRADWPNARRAEACVKARANADFRAHRYALAIEGYSEVLAVLDDVRAQRRGRRRLAAARARGAARLA
jgi:hypothetical protein